MAPPSVDAASTTASAASTGTAAMAATNGVAHAHVHAPALSSSSDRVAAAAATAPEESADRAGTPRKGSLVVERLVRSRMPTRHGEFFVTLYRSSRDPAKEHMAIAMGDVAALSSPPLVRIHSECFTGEVLGSQRCDCGEQLQTAMASIAKEGVGVVVYLRQEGRGIGLLDKLRAYNLQDQGLDTVDANVQLGHGADERTYDEAALILHDLGVTGGVRLLTNNLDKIEQLRAHGIAVAERIQMTPTIVSADAAQYLHTKVARMNHQLQLPPLHSVHQPEHGGSTT